MGDSQDAIAAAIGFAALRCADVWKRENFSAVFALGDRYEMFAAVASTVPYGLPVFHFHGGELTFGAMDNIFRHAITCMSAQHFTSHKEYSDRIFRIVNGNLEQESGNIHTIGALALDNLKEINLLNKQEFTEKFGIDMSQPTVLFTLHPQTKGIGEGVDYLYSVLDALEEIEEQVIITLPNADTHGSVFRKAMLEFAARFDRIFCAEALGLIGYYSAMTHSKYVIGNSSSGIIEAASFGRYVIDIGDRQKGRVHGGNVFNCGFDKVKILELVEKVKYLENFEGENIYGNGNASYMAMNIIEKYFRNEEVA